MTKVALYVEGRAVVQPWGESPLERLWKELARRVYASAEIEIVGISKGHIEALKFDPRAPGSKEKLPTNVMAVDQFIRDRHHQSPLINIVIAFDCKPAITVAGIQGTGRCAEIEWVLRRLIERRVLPDPFLSAARKLQALYGSNPKAPRRAGRPPRLPLELLFMDPCFDGLFAADETTVRTATGHARYPKDWPTFDAHELHPERGLLNRATKLATREAHKGIRGSYVEYRNEWGYKFVRTAKDNARLFKHPIATRLGTLLV